MPAWLLRSCGICPLTQGPFPVAGSGGGGGGPFVLFVPLVAVGAIGGEVNRPRVAQARGKQDHAVHPHMRKIRRDAYTDGNAGVSTVPPASSRRGRQTLAFRAL